MQSNRILGKMTRQCLHQMAPITASDRLVIWRLVGHRENSLQMLATPNGPENRYCSTC